MHLAGTPQESLLDDTPLQELPAEPMELTPVVDSQGRPVFAFTLEDFILYYNSLWNEDFLPPAQQWTRSASLSERETPVGDCRSGSPAPEVWFLPTVSVYTRTGDPAIWKVSVEMDEHSDSPEKHDLFRQMSLHALALFFPALNQETREALYLSLDDQAYASLYTGFYHADLIPQVLYHQDGIGVFPFFAIGEYERFTFLPVTQDLLDTWASGGTQVIDLDQWHP